MSFCWFVHFRPFTYLQCFLSARCGAARLNRCLCFVFVFGGPIKSKPQRDDHTIHNDNREAAVVGRVVPTPKASSVLFRCDPTATRKMARPSVRSRRKNYEQTMWQPTPLTAAAVASFAPVLGHSSSALPPPSLFSLRTSTSKLARVERALIELMEKRKYFHCRVGNQLNYTITLAVEKSADKGNYTL